MEKYYKEYITFNKFYLLNRKWGIIIINDIFKDFKDSEGLYDMFVSMYNEEQISVPCYYQDDITQDDFNKVVNIFSRYVQYVTNEFVDYYNEMYDNYKKEFDYTLGITNSVETEGINVDLPNKKIDSESIYSYPSSGDKGKSVYTDNSKFLSMKRQYLSQIRDLNREFARKYKDCFLHILVEKEEITKKEYEDNE